MYLPPKIISLSQVDHIRQGAIGVLSGQQNFYVFEWAEGGPGRATIATVPVDRYLQLSYCFKPVEDFSIAVAAPANEPPPLRFNDSSGGYLPGNHPQRKEINWGKFWTGMHAIMNPKRSEFEALGVMFMVFIATLIINQQIVHADFKIACFAFLAALGASKVVQVVFDFFVCRSK